MTRSKPASLLRVALIETIRALDACPYTETPDLREFGAVFLNRFLTHYARNWPHAWDARWLVADCSELSAREAAEIVGAARGRGATLEEAVAFELAECVGRNETSSRVEDRPVRASQVVGEREARRTRELTALAFRRWKMRAA